MIDRTGWAVRCVIDPDPALCVAYTVGLMPHGHPEIVMTGLPFDPAKAFLNIAGEVVVREGGSFVAGQETTELAEGPPMPIIEVRDQSALTAVDELYGEVSAVQIIWTDSKGRLPWEPEYANPPGTQPLLGERPDR